MPKIVRDFELSTVTRSVMRADVEYPGGENKEELVHTVCKVVPNCILNKINDEVHVSVMDAMQVVQKLNMPDYVKTFKDLAEVSLIKLQKFHLDVILCLLPL